MHGTHQQLQEAQNFLLLDHLSLVGNPPLSMEQTSVLGLIAQLQLQLTLRFRKSPAMIGRFLLMQLAIAH
ncbi:hypothetical protein MCEMAEM21_02708 [Oxalobacteraceae bacterium]